MREKSSKLPVGENSPVVPQQTTGLFNCLGKVYDQETQLYYLQSRYYNPAIGRFINADALVSTGQGTLGNNVFAYCANNPVGFTDSTGTMIDFGGNPTSKIEQAMMIGGAGAGIALVIVASEVLPGILDFVQQGISDLAETIQDSKLIEYQYWEAYRDKNGVHIGRGLTLYAARLRVALGLDIMCANQDAARWILVLNGYWAAVGPEKHGEDGFFWHYHPHRHTHTHIWFL